MADETIMEGPEISGKMDQYLLNEDIGGVLGKFVFDNLDEVLEDANTVSTIFGDEGNKRDHVALLTRYWTHWD